MIGHSLFVKLALVLEYFMVRHSLLETWLLCVVPHAVRGPTRYPWGLVYCFPLKTLLTRFGLVGMELQTLGSV